MNAAVLLLFGVLWFVFAYFWYGNIIKKKVIHSDNHNLTPSHEMEDGVDFVPSKNSILFGHHFSSIAGAGPIVGPIIAFAFFGWLPAVIWILVGSVFIGAVHDYTTLMISVRNKGKSIVDISDKVISKKAKSIFTLFVWITLMLVQAVFADLVAKTLENKPEIAIPMIGLIVLALIFGYFVFKKGLNLALGTALALLILYGFIQLGQLYPIEAGYNFWLTLTILYALGAATLPVQVLLQPRDYISMFILVIGMVLGLTGMFVMQPEINAPAFISFDSEIGPLFPIIFITIACGAISGFHSLVSGGTTSKQLDKEGDGKKIAYGGMLMEGLLALLVIVMISSVLVWGEGKVAAGAFNFQEMMKKGPIIVFGNSFGLTAEAIGIPVLLATTFGVLMLKAFILTTLDTSARLNRYIFQESAGKKFGGIFNNKYFATAASLIVAYFLCLFDGYKVLWPMFGTSNQLIATLSLFVVSAYLFGFKVPKWYTLAPAVLMLVVCEAALIYQAIWQFWPDGSWHLSVLSGFLAILGLVVAGESYSKLREYTKERLETAKAKA